MKKILSLALAAMMVVSVLPVAYAADVDYTAGTAVEYTADADANRSYTITVPAELQPGQSGTVTLKGKWASNETVKVTADASVELTNSINAADKHTLDITFLGIEKAGDNTVEKTYTETVAVAEMPAAALFGTWSGKFNYNVAFNGGAVTPEPDDGDEANLITFTLFDKTYQAEEGMTWREWVNSEYNTVNWQLGTYYNADGEILATENGDILTSDGQYLYADTAILANTKLGVSNADID